MGAGPHAGAAAGAGPARARSGRAFHHEVSARLVKTHDRLVLEDLATAGLLRNPRLSRAIADAGWAAFARLVAYKAACYGTRLAVAPRWYPTTPRRRSP